MAHHQPSPDRERRRAADVAASQQLAAALRRSRLTLLCGAPGAGKSALLADGLLPLLRRRGGDARVSATRTPSPTVLPFPDRRSRGDRAALAELVVMLDAWETPSIDMLHDGIDAALRAAHLDPEWYREPLAERVRSLESRFGTRFLFVLDGFEAVLEAADDDRTRFGLLDELVGLLNAPLPVHLLIALRADAEPLLAPWLEQLQGVRAEVLQLEGGRIRRVYGAAVAPPAASSPASPEPFEPLAPSKPRPTELSQFDRTRMAEAANTGAPALPDPPRPAPRVRMSPPGRPKGEYRSAQHEGTPVSQWRLAALASVALVAIVGGVAWVRLGLPSGEHPPTATASTPSATIAAALPAAPVPAALPTPPRATPPDPAPAAAPQRIGLALRVDTDNAGTRLPRELAQALAADGGADVQVVPMVGALPGREGGKPGLAVVRYDALQAATRAGAKPDLAVIAPLYTEELQIAVRADSALRFIHQIEGQRIDIGAAAGARALTAQALYRQMFGRPLPAAKQSQLDAPTALQRLLAGERLDAVVLVGAQPAAALAALAPAERRRIRLLALAPDHPASARALQAYLPALLREPGGATTPTLGAMSFLVASGRPDADTARVIAGLASSLCRHLPVLQSDGDAKWRALSAGLQLDTGLPPAGAADAAWRACTGTGVSSASPTVPPSPATTTRN